MLFHDNDASVDHCHSIIGRDVVSRYGLRLETSVGLGLEVCGLGLDKIL